MKKVRIIGRLDIKGPNLIKGVHLEGLRVIGSPEVFAKKYYEQGVDELVYLDSVASLYGRNNLHSIVKKTAKEVFIPLTVGGGIRSVKDVNSLLRVGADKISINTAAVKRPELLKEIAETYGSQALVLSIEAKKQNNSWEVLTDNGRERTGLDVFEWSKQAIELGIGEILITSIDKEGTQKGFDIDLIKKLTSLVNIPVIVSGGLGKVDHLLDVIKIDNIDAVAVASFLHYEKGRIIDLKKSIPKDLASYREVYE